MALQVWLPLTGSTTQQGLSSITMSGSPNSWVAGKLGQCAHFAGSASNCIYNNTTEFNYTDNFSYAVWIKHSYSSGGGTQYAFTVGRADAGGYGYSIATGSSNIVTRFGSKTVSVNCPQNEWHHVAVTISGTTMKTYMDGVLANTSATATLPTYSDGNGLGLGCFHYSGNIYPYYGDLQDFRIYNHCLSALEVKQISQALILHYPMTGGGRGQANLYTGTADFSGNWDGAGSWTTDTTQTYKGFVIKKKTGAWGGLAQKIPATNGDIFTISFYAKVDSGGNVQSIHRSNLGNVTTGLNILGGNFSNGGTVWIIGDEAGDKWKYCWATVQIVSTDITWLQWRIENSNSTTTMYICGFKMERGDKPTPWIPHTSDAQYTTMGYNNNTEYDVSGYLHNATCTNTSYSSDAARYPVSTVFNKTAYLDVSALTIDMTQVTFAAWFKIASAQTWSRIFDFGSTEGGGYCFGLATGNNGTTLVVYGRRGSSGASLPDKTIQTISLNTWYHAVITLSGTTCKCYVNGTLVISYEITSAYPNSVAFALRYLGKSVFSADKLFDGNISDFRIYGTALSAEDIQKLYNTAVSISNNGALLGYEFVEV